MTTPLQTARKLNADLHLASEDEVLTQLGAYAPSLDVRGRAVDHATHMVRAIREDDAPGMMEVFLAEYGLSTREGVALMCLAEALLRVPDANTMDALIEDKIAPSDWGKHLGQSSSPLVNASTWALMLTGKVLQDGEGLASVLKGALRRVGEPVIRTAVSRAMREMGEQFVLGETISEAIKRGAAARAQGYTYSYDMLGEAAMTHADAQGYFEAYNEALSRLAEEAQTRDIRTNPGISIKLSALHPRYEEAQRDHVLDALVPRVLDLALGAKAARMGLNIDAEEAARLELSLDVIEAVLRDPRLAGWDGFGVVVQAYSKRALGVIEWLNALALELDRKFMVRLVKGAYWDTEIKLAQVEGLEDFPVFTRKAATDVSYAGCAARLLDLRERIYPQFATHNAHSVALVMAMAGNTEGFEFQRLHGMGEALHNRLVDGGYQSRIYAPVGAHRDLLAYLVRRLLENGANSSFVNQIVDAEVPAEDVAEDPYQALAEQGPNAAVVKPAALFGARQNSLGFDLANRADLARIEAARAPWKAHIWEAGSELSGPRREVCAPQSGKTIGHIRFGMAADAERAKARVKPWQASAKTRGEVLLKAADLYEAHFGELFALLAREAGKTVMDAVAELREAVDFLRFYAEEGQRLSGPARGVFTCISPWNFPLAIFTGQIAAALAAGNGVIAKPAEATGLIASRAVGLLYEAGVPLDALQLVPGAGAEVGAALSTGVDGLCFTGSTRTAQVINRAMAEGATPAAPLIAETGGINAMIIDSTALPEQAVRDLVASAFQSAGQRCSAARIVYVQEDVAEPFLTMLQGTMDTLVVGDPWALSTDVGPVIDAEAKRSIEAHIATAAAEGRVLKQVDAPEEGTFVGPALIEVPGIAALEREVFGPVLHVARFAAEDLDWVVSEINGAGYGLTFGMHSRIDDRVEAVTKAVNAGNIYINRNQIGAVVESQPFGGEGLSGTGPKAGGPRYVKRFLQALRETEAWQSATYEASDVQSQIEAAQARGGRRVSEAEMPGPTGELNLWSLWGRGVVLCLGPTRALAERQAAAVDGMGAAGLAVPGLSAELLAGLTGYDAVVAFASDADLAPIRKALAAREGKIVPLLAEADFATWSAHERHLCVDTTASGGNAELLAASDG